MTDPLTLKAQEKFLEAVGMLVDAGIAEWKGRNDSNRLFAEARHDTLEDTVYAMRAQVAQLVEQVTANGSAKAQLTALINDHQFHRVQTNYVFEYAREPMDERRRMLEYAQTGSYNVDLTLAEIARVERTLRELDPNDVVMLVDIVEGLDVFDQIVPDHDEARASAYDSIVAAGCMRLRDNLLAPDGRMDWSPTTLGHNVARVMRGYVNARLEADPRPPKP
jgi:hypothetical protein